MSENNLALSGVVAFMVVSILILGFFLVVPNTYARLNATDLGAMGNATRDSAYAFVLNVQSVTSSILWVIAGATIVMVLAYALGRRFP